MCFVANLLTPIVFQRFHPFPGVSLFLSPLSFAVVLCIFTIPMKHQILNSTEVILTVHHIALAAVWSIGNRKAASVAESCSGINQDPAAMTGLAKDASEL